MVTANPKPKTGSKRLVMLDPGHGGIDTGAIGRNGSQEKHVVLAIAKTYALFCEITESMRV